MSVHKGPDTLRRGRGQSRRPEFLQAEPVLAKLARDGPLFFRRNLINLNKASERWTMTAETMAETLEQIGRAGAERRDMAKGEAVEHELDAFISKRHERPASGRRGRV